MFRVPGDVEGKTEVPEKRVFTLNWQILNLSCVSRMLTGKVLAPHPDLLNGSRGKTSRSFSMEVSTNKSLLCLMITLQ